MSDIKLPPLPEDDSIVHIYPWDLERMASNETTTTVFSVAVGCPDGESVPLYTADQMREYARAAQLAAPAVPANWRDFLIRLSHMEGSMVNGNRLSMAARELLDAALQGEGK